MELFIAEVEWISVLVSFVVAFGVGWLWYSPKLFLEGWLAGIGEPQWKAPMWMPMVMQLLSTLVLAIVINVMMAREDTILIVLVVLMLAGFIKANGLYCGKTKYAIGVEVLYILVMSAIMVGVNCVL